MEVSKSLHPLTNPQKSIWYTEKYYPDTSIGNVAGPVRFKGDINYTMLEKAINIVIEQNDGIRIRITEEDVDPLQYVTEYEYEKVDLIDFRGKDIQEFYKWNEEQTRIPFNLIGSKLYYFAMFRLDENEGGFYVKTQHLISDAWTINMIVSQIMENYTNIKNDKKIEFEKKPSYLDYIEAENEYVKSERFIKSREFWNEKYQDLPEAITIKSYKSQINETKAKRKTFIVPHRLTSKIHEYCDKNKVSPFMLFLSALSIYISRATAKRDIGLGTAVLNRTNVREKNMIGMFVSTIPMRIKVDNNIDFTTFVQEVSKEWMSLLRHQKYHYNLLLKDLRKNNDRLEKLFDITLSYQNAKLNKSISEEQYEGRWSFNGYQTGALTININDREGEGNLLIDYDFLAELFHVKEIEFMHDHLVRILWHALDNPQKQVSNLDMVSEKEKQKILIEFNDTEAYFPKEKTVVQLFEEQVQKTPDLTALVFNDSKMTYSELNEKANQIARILRTKGVKPELIVGVMAERSLEMVIGMMGVLKAGGAYLPIDPGYPAETIEHMIKDSGTKLILTQTALKEKINFEVELLCLDDEETYRNEDKSNTVHINRPNDLVYIIYTSGSTGKPKGVMIEHRNVVNLVEWFGKKYDIDKNRNAINNTSFSFDVSVEEITVSLLNGATVFIPEKEIILDRNRYIQYLNKNKINIAQFVPGLLRELLSESEKVESLNVVICGGEALDESLKNKMISKGYNLYNHYGPTEITVDGLIARCSEDKVTLGKPVDNVKCYILDKFMNLQPIGIPGQLCVSGKGVARGYLNKKDATKKKFVPNPFIAGETLYLTGDLARWYPEGEIEYLGRIDHQVKVRGHRVELYEIKLKLQEYKGIEEAVVVAKPDKKGNNQLVAYILPDQSKVKLTDISFISRIKEHLSKSIPSYMIPSKFIFINNIPLTSNGKIDIKALREVEFINQERKKIIIPENEIQTKLLYIFKEVLNLQKISIEESFFDAGGDSLDAISLAARIAKNLNVQILVRKIFEYPTIRELGEYIGRKTKNAYKEIKRIPEADYYELSSSQKRLYILSQIEKDGIPYNMPGIVEIEGKIDKTRIEDAFRKIVERHESLRTYFEMQDEKPVQKILKEAEFTLEYKEAKKEELEGVVDEFVRPFDLSKAPLLRVGLVKTAEGNSIMLFDMHHIISDGVSMKILVEEFIKLYEGKGVLPQTIQYKDYAVWHNELLKSESMKKQEEYWVEQFKEEIPILNMPTDYPRPAVQSFEGDSIRIGIEKELTASLRKLAKETGTTMYMLLLAAYNVLLSRYTGQEDIIVGTPVAGRGHADLENIMGMFVNTLAVRNRPKGEKTFSEFLQEVKENCIKAFENQDYPFEELVDKVEAKRDISRNPIFDTMFSMLNGDTSEFEADGEKFSAKEIESKISKFDLTVEAVEDEDRIQLNIEYCTKLFRNETIQRLAGHFINILNEISINQRQSIFKLATIIQDEFLKDKFIQEKNIKEDEAYQYITAGTVTEQKLVSVWEEILEISPIGINDNFFDIGGDSLGVIGLGARIKKEFEVDIPVSEIFRLPTIKGIAEYIEAQIKNEYKEIKRIPEADYYELSSSQKRLYILSKIEKDGIPYNMPGIVEIEGKIDRTRIEKAFRKIVERHESLRTYFEMHNGMPVQKILRRFNFNIEDKEAKKEEFEDIIKEFVKPFDLSKAPLLRVGLVKIDENRSIMLFDMHHIISDGISMRILVEEFIKLYEGKGVPPQTIQYKDYAVWHNELLKSENMKKQEEYWVEQLKEEIPILNMPTDYPRPAVQSFEGDSITVEVGKELTESLRKLAKETGTTMYMVLLAGYNVLLSRYTGQEDIIVGTPVAGRRHADLENIIGMFVSTLAIRNRPEGEKTFGEFLQEVKKNCIKAFENQDYPFEELVEKVETRRDISRNPIFDTMFAFLNKDIYEFKSDGAKFTIKELESKISKFDLTVEAVEEEDRIQLNIEYGTKLFKEETIQGLSGNYIKVLQDMILKKDELLEVIIQSKDWPFEIPVKLFSANKLDKEIENNVFESPQNEIEQKILNIWAEILEINEEEISINDNFFDLGGDSLNIIQFNVKAFPYNWGITIQDLYTHSTIKKLANKIIGISLEDKIKKNKSIGIEVIKLRNKDRVRLSGEKKKIENILLTGATGFLGIHLLDNLVSDTKANVYCLIRGEVHSENRLKQMLDFYFRGKHANLINKRIFVLNGDITLENFGLGKEEYEQLGEKIDNVINSAALVKHYGDYSLFEEVNVKGAERLIDFCKKYNCMLNHISTISVVGDYEGKEKFTENDLYIGQDCSFNVYVESKFEAEKKIFEEIGHGLKANVFRIGNLTGRNSDGHFQSNIKENAFYNKIKSIIELGEISEEVLDTDLEFSPVDLSSKMIIELLKVKEAEGKVFHVYNHNGISLGKFINQLKLKGINIKVIDDDSFDNLIKNISSNKKKSNVLEGIIEDLIDINEGISKSGSIDSTFTQEYLKGLGLSWNQVDEGYISLLVDYMKKVKFIK